MKQGKPQTYLNRAAKKPGVLKTWLLLFVGIVSAAALPIFSPQTTHAQAANVYVDRELFSDVTANIYRDAIAACVYQNGTIPGGDSDAIVSGEWFVSGKAVVGPMLDDDDERRNCSTPFLVNQAMAAFGFDSNTEAACRLGLIVRANESDCINGSGAYAAPFTNPSPQEVQAAIDRQRFFNPDQPNSPGFSWTDPKRYIYYARSFEIGCRATPIVPYDEATTDQKNLADNSSEYLWMRVVTPDGSNIKMIYQLGDDHKRGSDIGMKNNNENFGEVTNTCLELAQLANDNTTAYAQYVQTFPPDENDPGAGAGDPGEAEEPETTCAVEGLGWLLCPAMTVIGKIVDAVYAVVSGMLRVEPISTNTDTPLFNAWAIMRNFANVAFVIAFLIIIYSQITSVGISNYGIKRMLPRLIIAAILVNVSYWVCAVAVDVSNIAGASIKGLFDGLIGQVGETGQPNLLAQIGGWTGLTALVIAGAAIAVYVGLSVLLPLLVGALIAIITVVIILTLRQALIIILIVISPLAFVAFLLPNTEGLFTSWRKLFVALLLMFPIIAAIFGGSALAGNIILNSAGGNILIQIVGAGVTVIPLFLSALVMFMVRSVGGAFGRLAGMVNRPDRGAFDRMRRGAEGVRERQEQRRSTRALGGGNVFGAGRFQRRARREAIRAGVEAESKRAQGAYVAEQALGDQAFQNRLAGGLVTGASASPEALNRAVAGAISAQARIEAEEVTAASAIIKNANLDQNEMRRVAMGGAVKGVDGSSIATRAAAMKNVVDTHDVGGVNQLLDNLPNMDAKTREHFADALQSSKEKPQYVSQGVIAENIRQGKGPALSKDAQGNELSISKQLTVNAINNNTYSAEKIATGDKDELIHVASVAADPNIQTNNAQIADNAQMALTDERLSGMVGKNANVVDDLSRL